jgi:hypothetical protein
MKSAGGDEPAVPDEALAEKPRSSIPPDLIRDMILSTTAVAMLAAWLVYEGLRFPEERWFDLLLAVVCVLSAIKAWLRRPIGGWMAAEPNWSFRRTLAALSPLFVLGLVTFAYVMHSRQQAAEKVMTQRKEVWKQSVERQRQAVELASKQMSDASREAAEATKALNKTAVQVKLPDGKVDFRFDPEASRKWKSAVEAMVGATKRHSAEMDRLLGLQFEEPGRYGRP